MSNNLRTILLLSTLLGGSAAVAQIPTSSEEVRWRAVDPSLAEVARTDAVFRDLVACVVRYQPARSRNLLDTVPGTSAEATILYSFQSRMETCYDYNRTGGRALGWHGNLLRGVIAEVYYHREFPHGVTPANAVPAEATAPWAAPRPAEGDRANGDMVHAMARCVLVRRPADVHALLASTPFSAGERNVMRSLQPDLATCLDTGVELSASRQALRGLFAEAALHYGEAQRGGFARVGRAEGEQQ